MTVGARHDITGQLVSRRGLDCGGRRVHRLLVADWTGAQFPVLVTPSADPCFDLQSGERVHLDGLLGANAPSSDDCAGPCPSCDGRLRPGSVVDTLDTHTTIATRRLSLTGVFGVVDSETTVRRADQSSRERARPSGERVSATGMTAERVDDWRPRDVSVPDRVCLDCGEWVEGDAERPRATTPRDPGAVGLSDSFREHIAAGQTPPPATTEPSRVFAGYRFDPGERPDSPAWFRPCYGTGVSDHPLTGETERYLYVGLDTAIPATEFERPPLELVVVFDSSASMTDTIRAGDHSNYGQTRSASHRSRSVPTETPPTNHEVAVESVCALTRHLHESDRFGVVLCADTTHVAKPPRAVGDTEMTATRRLIREIAAGEEERTDGERDDQLAAAVSRARDLLADRSTHARTERRIVLVTDRVPPIVDGGELRGRLADATVEGVHTTVLCVGAEPGITATQPCVRGLNYECVRSPSEFEQRLETAFDCLVMPLVYDLSFELGDAEMEIAAAHGTPDPQLVGDDLVHVGTLFPEPEGSAGGLVLARLDGTTTAELELTASWTERGGRAYTEQVRVDLDDSPETFSHDGVAKSIALARYARELSTWAETVHERAGTTAIDEWVVPDQGGQHGDGVPLAVPDSAARRFVCLGRYLDRECDRLDDEMLRQECQLLDTLGTQTPEIAVPETD